MSAHQDTSSAAPYGDAPYGGEHKDHPPYQAQPPEYQPYPSQQQQQYNPSQQQYPPGSVDPNQHYIPPQAAPQHYAPPGAEHQYPPPPAAADYPGQYGPPVVTQQPSAQQQPRPANCPPGLEYLSMLDQLLVKQKIELLEMMTGFETQNQYRVLNVMGQPVYSAKEDSDCLVRQCCGPARPFEMEITDNFGHDVIHLNRGLRCTSCCCPCCLQKMEVSSPPGTVIGTVEQNWSIFYPNFSIKDEHGRVVLKIKGPFCTCNLCCGDVDFIVSTPDGQQVGKISKQWSGLGREAFTDADNFGISFPQNLDVKIKATLLGAVFLIDFMFFEQSGNNNNNRPGMMD